MIVAIAVLIALILAAAGILHAMWATGSVWPGRDEEHLARMVTGFPGATTMPHPVMAGAVAIALFAAAFWAIAMTGGKANAVLTLGGFALMVVFLVRGWLGYTPWWRAMTPEEPFASFDRIIYSPLCLALGAGFAVLVLWRLF